MRPFSQPVQGSLFPHISSPSPLRNSGSQPPQTEEQTSAFPRTLGFFSLSSKPQASTLQWSHSPSLTHSRPLLHFLTITCATYMTVCQPGISFMSPRPLVEFLLTQDSIMWSSCRKTTAPSVLAENSCYSTNESHPYRIQQIGELLEGHVSFLNSQGLENNRYFIKMCCNRNYH